jgi:DNA-binding MarR family transcriptional regulator
MKPRTPELPVDEVLEFLGLIWAVDHGLQRASKQMEAQVGITASQRFVLRLVGQYPGMTASQVAAQLRVHPSTVTGLLKRLCAKGLIALRKDPRDARRSFIGLTRAGRAAKLTRAGLVEAAVLRVLGRLPSPRIAAARQVLIALTEELEPPGERYRPVTARPRAHSSRPG